MRAKALPRRLVAALFAVLSLAVLADSCDPFSPTSLPRTKWMEAA